MFIQKTTQKATFLTIASTLALALGAASAQTATPATPATPATTPAPAATPAAQVVTFTDVPAGHFAKDAVDLIVQKGLIQGFPDGTFRGNDNLTRYQAALIFYRLLQSGTLGSGGVSAADTTTIANGMQEVSTELASVSSRVTDLEKLTADQQTRIAALETQIAGLGTAGASADTTALTARIDALEAAVKAIPAGPAGPAGAAADTTALDARLTALEAKVAAAPATTAPVTTPTTTAPTTNPSTIVIGDTGTTATTASTAGRLYVGANYDYSLGGKQGSYGAVVGTTQAIGPVGAQVSVDYQPANGTINADASATLHLNQGAGFSPYLGAGFGLTSSKKRDATNPNVAAATGTSTDYSVNGLAGIDYRFTDSLGVYVEAVGRYYITNNGVGTGLQGNKSGFGSTAKAGLKFFF